jgi:hypothetical protein
MDSMNLNETNSKFLLCEEGFQSTIEFARAIDLAAEEGAIEKFSRPLPRPQNGPDTAGGDNAAKISLSVISALMEKAATKEEQLELSAGLPCVLNIETQRYSLASNAQAVLDFTIQNANRPPPKLNLNASTLFATRRQAAQDADAEAQAALVVPPPVLAVPPPVLAVPQTPTLPQTHKTVGDWLQITGDSITHTYGDLPELYQSWYPTISSDTELPEKLHCLVPPKTIREWLTRYNSKEEYNRVTFVEAFEIFKTDIAARQPCVIHIRMHCSRGDGFQAYTAHFNRRGEYTINVPGYSDEQRQQLTYDSLYSEDLKYAIVASAVRMDR